MNKLYLREEYPDWLQRLETEPLLQNPLLNKDIWHTVEDSVQYLKNQILYLKRFSQFLSSKSIDFPEQIEAQCWEDFDYYLRSNGLSNGNISIH